ncbi:hypothetical protein ACVWY3_004975 [Bradyrhizobium sp. USDA 4486]
MSGYLRLCFVSLVLIEILSTAPASSNPLTDLLNTAAAQPSVSSPPQAECVGRPGNSAPDGQHWVYRLEGHRKCWFLTEAAAKVKKIARRAPKATTASLDESGTARPRQSGILDARAELLRSTPGLPSQPPRPELKTADADPDLGTSTALTSAALIAQNSRRPPPSQIDVEQLLAAAPPNDVATSSGPPNITTGVRLAEASNEAASRTATLVAVLLIVLGMLSILSSSRSLRHAVRFRS